MSKLDMLKEFMDRNKNLAPQGSLEWHLARKTTFGGSELNNVINGNVRNVISDKVGYTSSPFYGNIYTDAGTLYEEISRLYMEKVLKTSIYEFGSCPTSIKGVKISPDGICNTTHEMVKKVVKLPESIKKFPHNDVNCLIEIKNPYNRIPNGKIPKQYCSQLQGGIYGLGIIDYGIFVDCVTRRCILEDLYKNPTHDNPYFVPNKDTDLCDKLMSVPVARGVIGIYDVMHTYSYRQLMYIHKNPVNMVNIVVDKPVDVGTLDTPELAKFFRIINKLTFKEYIQDNLFNRSARYSKLSKKDIDYEMTAITNNILAYQNNTNMFKLVYDEVFHIGMTPPQDNLQKLKDYAKANNYKFVGYIPWKMNSIDIIGVNKDPEFANIIPIIEQHATLLEQISNSRDPIKELHTMFNIRPQYDYITDTDTDSDTSIKSE